MYDVPPTEIYTLSLTTLFRSLSASDRDPGRDRRGRVPDRGHDRDPNGGRGRGRGPDRKSTRLNSSHQIISYAVFCLKKKTLIHDPQLYVSAMSSKSSSRIN